MTTPTRKQLIQDYKLQPTYYGVIQITNTVNHKIYIDTVPNTKNRWAYYKVNLNNHFYVNSPLQADWEAYGEDAFYLRHPLGRKNRRCFKPAPNPQKTKERLV